MICPKCNHQRTEHDDPLIPDYQCPVCGVVYSKYKPEGFVKPIQPKAVEVIPEPIIPKPQAPTPKAEPKPPPTEHQILLDMTECQRHKTNHILHFLISVISFGGWLVIWLLITASDTSSRNDIHAKYNIPREDNNAGLLIGLIIALVVTGFVIR